MFRTSDDRVMNRVGILQILAASFCFGFLGLFSRWATQLGLSTGFLLTYRFAFAALLLGIFFLIRRPRALKLSRNQFWLSLGLGFLGYAVFSTLYFWSIERISIPLAVMLLYTYPFWIHLFQRLLGQPLEKKEWFSLLTASAGLVLLFWGEVNIQSFWGILFGAGSGLTYALYILISHRYQKNESPWAVSVYIMMAASLGLFLFHRPPLSPLEMSAQQWGLVLAMSLFCSILPLSLVLASLQKLPSSVVSLLSLFEPVTAVVASALLFQEPLGARQGLGIGIILLALASRFIDLTKWKSA